MPKPKWSFRKVQPATKRDPFEAEFFTEDKEDESVFSRTDALVREAVQNALDARVTSNTPVTVRLAVDDEGHTLPPAVAQTYVDGLIEHLDRVGNEVINKKVPVPPMRFLVYEDFGTRGLCGDPARTRDPVSGDPNPEDFYWFWWNVGRSGKGGADRGRWGLGKTVFHSTSKINSIFGLTVRATDKKKLLMGQSVIKTHFIQDAEYPPEGFFHDPAKVTPIEQPSEDADFISEFEKTFGLRRGNQTGLSIVVPYRFDNLRASEILKSVVVQYFLPILRGQLVVVVSGPDLAETQVNANTIRDVSNAMSWTGKRTEKKHAPPPFDFAEWAIAQQAKGIETELKPAGLAGAPAWSEDLLGNQLDCLRKKFAAHERIAIRVPLTVEKKVGGLTDTYFDVFIDQDDLLEKGEDHFIREGMTISKVSTLSSKRAVRGLVLVEQKVLSALLGDAEGPAHVDWGRTEDRPDKTYIKWPSRVSFVKNSLAKLIEYLTPPPQDVNFDLLSSIFSVADVARPGAKKSKGKTPKGKTPPPPPPPKQIPTTPRWFKVAQTTGGFRVRRSGAITPVPGAKLRVRAAYELPEGDAFISWSSFDFVFDGKTSNPIKVVVAGAKVHFSDDNQFIVEVEQPDFTVDVRGFDRVRDLVVRYAEEKNGEATKNSAAADEGVQSDGQEGGQA